MQVGTALDLPITVIPAIHIVSQCSAVKLLRVVALHSAVQLRPLQLGAGLSLPRCLAAAASELLAARLQQHLSCEGSKPGAVGDRRGGRGDVHPPRYHSWFDDVLYLDSIWSHI